MTIDCVESRSRFDEGFVLPATAVDDPSRGVAALDGPPPFFFPVLRRGAAIRKLSSAVSSAPLTVVWAPAGAGKTTLAVTWAAQPPPDVEVRWIRNDLRGPSSDTTSQLDAFLAQGSQPRPSSLRVAVVDNAEGLTDAGYEVLDTWMRERPVGLRVILLSRSQPPLPLHRYRLDGSVAELSYDDLVFSSREAKTLLGIHDVQVSDSVARRLVERTGGWAAGIRMAALTMSRSAETVTAQQVEAAVKPSHNLMADYLVAELIEPMSPVEKQILVSTCVYPEIDPDLVHAVTGRTDCGHQLIELSRRHAFVQASASSPDSFRVHPLLRQALYAEACHEDPDVMTEAHRRAGHWYADRGQATKALEHLLLAREWSEVDRFVIERALPTLLAEPEGEGVARRIVEMPDADPADDSVHPLVRAAAALRLGDAAGARDALTRAGGNPSDRLLVRRAHAVIAMSVHHAAGDTRATLTAASEAEGTWSRSVDGHAAPTALRVLVLRTRGEAEARAGLLDAATSSLTSALRSGDGALSPRERMRCLSTRAFVAAAAGRLSAAIADVSRVDELSMDERESGRAAPVAHDVVRAWIAVERLDTAGAERILGEVSRRREPSLEPLMAGGLTLLQIRLKRDRGVDAGVGSTRDLDGIPIRWLEELADAEAWGPRGTAASRKAQVRTPVERSIDRAECHAAAHDLRRARDDLLEALRVAGAEGIQRPFTHLSAALSSLLQTDPAVVAASQWLRQTATISPGKARPDVGGVVDQTLSAKELEVLRHLARLLTNEEIAAAMFISVNTVKTHIRSILRKLAVSRRNLAVRRAQQLGIV